MPAYNWQCQVCDTANSASTEICISCKSPANLNSVEIDARKAAFNASGEKQYTCPKCGHHEFKFGEIRVSGGVLGSFFEVEGEHFSYVACEKCRFTEFYLGDKEDIISVLDYLT